MKTPDLQSDRGKAGGFLFIIFFFFCFEGKGQSESKSFNSLELPVHAAIAAIGGVNVSSVDKEVVFFQNNPALSSDTLNSWAGANHLFYFANVGFSTFAYQHNFHKIGPIAFGINHLSLGNIEGYDATGMALGDFNSGETTLVLSKAHQAGHFRVGINLKGVFSNLAGYRSSALAVDIGGTFVHPSHDLSIGLVIKNVGWVMNEFSPTSSSKLPFDVQAGLSYKPEHMPFRFSLTAYRLADYNIPYHDANGGMEEPTTLDKVASHLTFGGEVLIHKNISVLLGYNFLRHQELKLESAGGGSGFSVGASANISQFNFAMSRSGYVTGGAYQVSMSINLSKLIKRK